MSKYPNTWKIEWVTVAALSNLACALSSSREWYYAAMRLAIDRFRLLLISLAGWLNQQQQDVIDYLQEENRVLREQLGGKRLRFSDDQRRRLAAERFSAVSGWAEC